MKTRLEKILFLILIALSLSACNGTSSPVISTPNSTQGNPFPSPTNVASTIPAPTQTPDPNAKTVKFNNISFVIPGPLARTATFKMIPAVTANKSRPWLVAPQYIHITLSGYSTPKGSYLVPEIFIYPAQDYAAINSGAKASLQKLQAILTNPSATLTNDSLPWLPFTPGEQSIATQPKIITFASGSGVRILTQYDIFLDPVVTAPGDPIVNRLLFYHFEGLSNDGKNYIVAILPLETAILANNPDLNAPVPAGGVPYPGLGTDIAHYDYFKAVTDTLNAANPDSFQPSLNLLDAMIASIEISP